MPGGPCHRPYLPQYPGVLDEELGTFLKDATFNFALNQSVEYTDDPGLVADVGLYCHLASEAAGWKARADQLNKFGAAYHCMQETFMGGYSAYTTELKAVEERLVAARARTRVHVAMVQLISQGQLGGRHYWMGLPGLDAHPCPKSFQNLLASSWPRTWRAKCTSQSLCHFPHISLVPQMRPLPPLLLAPLSLPSSQSIPLHLRIVAAAASAPKMSALIAAKADTLAGSARPPMSTALIVGIASCEQRATASTPVPTADKPGSCAKRSRHRQG